MSELRIVLSSISDKTSALLLARKLVDAGLVACVNLTPGCVSVYEWKSSVEEESECLMMMKTTQSRLRELERVFHKEHPYELPEFLVLDSVESSREYLTWALEQVGE